MKNEENTDCGSREKHGRRLGSKMLKGTEGGTWRHYFLPFRNAWSIVVHGCPKKLACHWDVLIASRNGCAADSLTRPGRARGTSPEGGKTKVMFAALFFYHSPFS